MTPITLPVELISKIFFFASDNQAALYSCCLVCKNWLEIAQPLLFESVSINSIDALVKFHRSLMGSNRLGPYVRELDLGPVTCFTVDIESSPDELIADCLKQTYELRTFQTREHWKNHVNDLVIHEACCLKKLKHLAINAINDNNNTYKEYYRAAQNPRRMIQYDPTLLLALPQTVDHLELHFPPDALYSSLPKICQKLRGTRPSATTHLTEPTASSMTSEQAIRETGLRKLCFRLNDHYSREPSVASFTAIGRSLATTLTTFQMLGACLDVCRPIALLAATPLVQHLEIRGITLSPDLFNGLSPLTQLRSLIIEICGKGSNSKGFSRALGRFLSHSPLLSAFEYREDYGFHTPISKLINVLIESTTKNGTISTLRSIKLLRTTDATTTSFARLCHSAPLLQTLVIPVRKYPLLCSRLARSLESLKHLCNVEVESPRSIYTCQRCLGGDTMGIFEIYGGDLASLRLGDSEDEEGDSPQDIDSGSDDVDSPSEDSDDDDYVPPAYSHSDSDGEGYTTSEDESDEDADY